jgi:hypothetical protein
MYIAHQMQNSSLTLDSKLAFALLALAESCKEGCMFVAPEANATFFTLCSST